MAHSPAVGLIRIVGNALLLSVVLIEAALQEAVPIAAATGDKATVATTFALSNGVFAGYLRRWLPRRCCSAAGFRAPGSTVLHHGFGRPALIISALITLAGDRRDRRLAGPDLRHRHVGGGSHLDSDDHVALGVSSGHTQGANNIGEALAVPCHA